MFHKSLMAACIGSCFIEAKRGGGRSSGGGTTAPEAGSNTGTVNVELLRSIADATKIDSFVYTADAHSAPLIAAGYAEVNRLMTNDKGEKATRATPAGIEYAAQQGATSANQTETERTAATGNEGRSAFTIVKGVEPPKPKRGGRSGMVYPFDSMEVGDSFFVPATNEKPNPAKSLASTVSSATARYAVKDGTKQVPKRDANGNEIPGQFDTVDNYRNTRVFVARAVEDGAPWGSPGVKGAGVFRIADNAPAAAQ